MLRFTKLLNKVSRLRLLEILLMRTNCCVRFDFCGSTVLVDRSGDPVSFYTTPQPQPPELLGQYSELAAFVWVE